MTLSRIERDCYLLNNPDFQHMTMFGIEAGMYDHTKSYGGHPNIHAIPYPTWFRFQQSNVAQQDFQVDIVSASFGQTCAGLSATDFMVSTCGSKPWCAIQVPVEVKGCRINELHGTYRCHGAPQQFDFHVKANSWVQGNHASSGQATILGCRRGPCWIWGDCHKPLGQERTGPLVAFVGSDRENANQDHEREPFRYKSMTDCKSRPMLCVLFDTGSRSMRVLDFEGDKILKMNELLMASVFCLNPPGDTPTRKGTFDSLLAGCIPVIFDEASLAMYEWHLPNWRDVSVYIPPEAATKPDFNIVDHLATISVDEVRSKQASIQSIAFSLQYSTTLTSGTPWHMDAFDIAMSKAVANAGVASNEESAPMIKEGQQLIRTEAEGTKGSKSMPARRITQRQDNANPSSDTFLASGMIVATASNRTPQIRKHSRSSITTSANGVVTRES